MAKKKNIEEDVLLGDINEKLEHGHELFEQYKKPVGTVLGIILGVAIAYVGYIKFYKTPNENKAKAAMFMAEDYFMKDSFALALNGDGKNLGFKQIIDKYGSTDGGKLARFYAGVCNLKQNKYQEALTLFEKYESPDNLVQSRKHSCMGDAYMELGKKKEAIEAYKKAVESAGYNTVFTPGYLFKLAKVYELNGEKKSAIESYNELSEQYADSYEGRTAIKEKTRLEVSL
jgi:tetratricopeptide (TPR) repeat protein